MAAKVEVRVAIIRADEIVSSSPIDRRDRRAQRCRGATANQTMKRAISAIGPSQPLLNSAAQSRSVRQVGEGDRTPSLNVSVRPAAELAVAVDWSAPADPEAAYPSM